MTLHGRGLDLLTFWTGFEAELQTLALYSVGIAVYGLFIYFFYENLSRRNLLGERFQNPGVGIGRAILRGIRYLVVFPVVSFLFFMLLAFSFFFLAPETTPPEQILLISMSVVTSVRITAYISENTSHDIAKLLPLGLLGVYLVQLQLDVDQLRKTVDNFRAFLDPSVLTGVVLRYLLFLVVLEAVLRLIYLAVRPKPGEGEPKDPDDEHPARTKRDPDPPADQDPPPAVEDYFEQQ